MNTVDTLLSNVFAVLMAIGMIGMIGSLAVAYMYRHADLNTIATWKQMAVFSVLFGVVSGRVQLIVLTMGLIMACVFQHFGMPKMAMITIASSVLNFLYCLGVYMVNVSIRKPVLTA